MSSQPQWPPRRLAIVGELSDRASGLRPPVLAQKPTARPAPGEPRRALNPRVAGRDKWKRIEALWRLVEFLRSYRAAWKARRAGEAAALFPHGTYLLRVLHGVPCAGVG